MKIKTLFLSFVLLFITSTSSVQEANAIGGEATLRSCTYMHSDKDADGNITPGGGTFDSFNIVAMSCPDAKTIDPDLPPFSEYDEVASEIRFYLAQTNDDHTCELKIIDDPLTTILQ